MGGIACACASEECAVLGCRRVRDIQRRVVFEQQQSRPIGSNGLPIPGLPVWTDPTPRPAGVKLPPVPLTEADIRRIVREEIANAMSSGVKP